MLGIHLVGSRVGELIAEGQLIYNWDAEAADVAALIHPQPTQCEIIGEAHLALAVRHCTSTPKERALPCQSP